jgi:hypothetical protein
MAIDAGIRWDSPLRRSYPMIPPRAGDLELFAVKGQAPMVSSSSTASVGNWRSAAAMFSRRCDTERAGPVSVG